LVVFSLLKKRGITFLSLSNTISQLGDRLTHMVIITLIGTMFPGRVSAFSEFAITWSLPIVILSPFAGVLIDHWNKQTIMLRCHIIQAILIFVTPFMVKVTGSILPIWILIILFFSLDMFNNTSKNSVIPDLVDYKQLVAANSLVITLARIATFIGMVGGGYLVRWVGWECGFYIDASTHFIAGILVLGMGARILFEPVKKYQFSLRNELHKSVKRFFGDLKELGILLVKDRAVIFVMLSVFILPFVAAVAYTILIYLVQQTFGLGTTGVGWFGGVIGVGMLLGGILMGIFGENINRPKIIIFSIALLAVFFISGPFLATAFFLYIIAFIAGVIFSFIGIAQDTILQEDVLKGIRGRIFATKEFVINLTVVISAIFFGVISKYASPYMIIQGVGIFLVCIVVFAYFIYLSIPEPIRSKL
jgi:DHA3 family macrolide efflux protein-like MFS transporter